MADRPNVLLIMVDQWRGDCLSGLGHPIVQTPFLDQLALNGTIFRRAYSATPTCIPARAALHTGLTAESHGRVGYQDGVPWNYATTMAGEFTRQGYQTQAIGKMHVYPERSQIGFQNVILHDGFLHHARRNNQDLAFVDDYVPWLQEQTGRRADYFDHGVSCNSWVARPWDKEEYLHPTNWAFSQAIDFMRRRDPRKPFFLFLSLHRPHPPYDPPAWAFDMYKDREMPGVPVGDWADLLAPYADPLNPTCAVGELAPEVLQQARAGYYGHMTHIDHQINRLVETLDEHNLGNTYICFTSDHGEMMGDHHMFRKAYPYEGSARVPMILRGPKGGAIPGRGVCDQVVALRDIMPTLLECAGLDTPESVEGQSFLPLAKGEWALWRNVLHGEHIVWDGSLQYLTDGHQKYIWFSSSGHEQLFDLDQDPQECHDLAQDPHFAEAVSHWRQQMIDELADREEGFVKDRRLVSGRPVNACLMHIR